MRGEGMHLSLAVALSDSSWAIGKDNKSKVSSNSLVIMMGACFVCFRSLNVMCLISMTGQPWDVVCSVVTEPVLHHGIDAGLLHMVQKCFSCQQVSCVT